MYSRRSNAAAAVLFAHAALFCTLAYSQQLDPSAPSEKPVAGFRSVDIGGRSLRYMCTGEGRPTVIIEPGGGTSLETVFSWNLPVGWQPIFGKVATVTRVCAYDRAGLGRSDPAPGPRNSLQVARDLHALLDKAGIRPP
jgi:pimeloyl-ACP methyl ester carboxylesterase